MFIMLLTYKTKNMTVKRYIYVLSTLVKEKAKVKMMKLIIKKTCIVDISYIALAVRPRLFMKFKFCEYFCISAATKIFP